MILFSSTVYSTDSTVNAVSYGSNTLRCVWVIMGVVNCRLDYKLCTVIMISTKVYCSESSVNVVSNGTNTLRYVSVIM